MRLSRWAARYLRLGWRIGDRQAGRAFESSFQGAGVEVSLALDPRTYLYLAGRMRWDDFDHPEANLYAPEGPLREETTWQVTTTLARMLAPRLQLTARATYTERDSNLGPDAAALDYERMVTVLGLDWKI